VNNSIDITPKGMDKPMVLKIDGLFKLTKRYFVFLRRGV